MSIAGFTEKIFAGRWLAGAKIGDAITVSKRFNRYGVGASINYLGEAFKEKQQVDATVRVYLALIREIRRNRINASISVKPSQLGLAIDGKLAARNYSRVTETARKNGVFTWLDMEEHRTVDDTIKLYRSQVRKKMVGICIQSYLKRSIDDIERLVERGAVIRLVKGAYQESPRIAYRARSDTTANYSRIMEYLFRHSQRFMIATHDPKMIGYALELNRSYRREVTYAMLNGIRNKALLRLAAAGNRTSVYIPFGERWLAYTLRRLREESNLALVARSLFENQRV